MTKNGDAEGDVLILKRKPAIQDDGAWTDAAAGHVRHVPGKAFSPDETGCSIYGRPFGTGVIIGSEL